MIDRSRWPYIQAYGDLVGLSHLRIVEEYLKAEATNAPVDAYASQFWTGWFQLRDYPRSANINLRKELPRIAGVRLKDLIDKEKVNGKNSEGDTD